MSWPFGADCSVGVLCGLFVWRCAVVRCAGDKLSPAEVMSVGAVSRSVIRLCTATRCRACGSRSIY